MFPFFACSQSGKRQDQLKLAQAWNRVDIAKDQLFGPDTEWEVSLLYSGCLKLPVIFEGMPVQNGLKLYKMVQIGHFMPAKYGDIHQNDGYDRS